MNIAYINILLTKLPCHAWRRHPWDYTNLYLLLVSQDSSFLLCLVYLPSNCQYNSPIVSFCSSMTYQFFQGKHFSFSFYWLWKLRMPIKVFKQQFSFKFFNCKLEELEIATALYNKQIKPLLLKLTNKLTLKIKRIEKS